MTKYFRNALLGVVAVFVLFQEAAGVPMPPLNVADLTDRSSLVVIGQVATVTDVGPATLRAADRTAPGRNMRAQLIVDQVIKGSFGGQSLQISFFIPDVFNGYRPVGDRDYGVFFLLNRNNRYEFLSPYYPVLPAVPGERIDGTGSLERVLAAQLSVLSSADAAAHTKQEAIQALSSTDLRRPSTIAGLELALKDPDQTVRLTAAATLLLANQLSALPIAEEALLQPDASFASYAAGLRFGISQGLQSQAAVPALVRLLSRGDAETRAAACWALGRSNAPSAIGPLVRALDDVESDVRYQAVVGLTELTGQRERRPSRPAFSQDPAPYLG
jgi:hypothetical protein